jgi:hypothetical protein
MTNWGLLRNVPNLLTFYPIIKPYGLLKIILKKHFHRNAIDRKLIISLIIGKIILKDGCKRVGPVAQSV